MMAYADRSHNEIDNFNPFVSKTTEGNRKNMIESIDHIHSVAHVLLLAATAAATFYQSIKFVS